MIVWFDLETSGIDQDPIPKGTDYQIIQIAAVVTDWVPGLPEVTTFEMKARLDPSSAVDQGALDRNSYSQSEWEETAVPESFMLKRFAGFLSRHKTIRLTSKRGKPFMLARLGGHNATSFDVPFLWGRFEKHGLYLPGARFPRDIIDTMEIAKTLCWRRCKWFDTFRLEALCTEFGIEWDENRAHDAYYDVRQTIELARRLWDAYEPTQR